MPWALKSCKNLFYGNLQDRYILFWSALWHTMIIHCDAGFGVEMSW